MLRSSIRAIAVPALVLGTILLALHYRFDAAIAGLAHIPVIPVRHAIAALAWAAGAVLICRVVEHVIWRQIARRRGRDAPHLLVQLTNLLIVVGMAFAAATMLFHVSLTGAIATSSVIGIVVGFATKSIISDTFSGIALNLDQAFQINDFVEIVGRGGDHRIMGRVMQINWRSTSILSTSGSMMVVPNTTVSESIVLNFSRPNPLGEFEQVITLDFDVPHDRAVRVLGAAVAAAARENSAITDTKARVTEISPQGVSYKIKYMLDPSRLGPGKAKDMVLGHVMRQLHLTGIEPANSSLVMADGGSRTHQLFELSHIKRLLSRVSLFARLPEEGITVLAEGAAAQRFGKGDKIITAGDAGETMYIISEGLVAVMIEGSDGDIDVATLHPGDFFGEMSLLTGEPRSASVVALADTLVIETDKADIVALLETNPHAAETLSVAAAERRLATDAASSARKPEELAAATSSLTTQILGAMMNFFGMKAGSAE